MKNKVTRQIGTGGMCAKQNTNTGSGSRPKGSRYMISSSNPQRSQQIRPANKIDNS